MTHTRLLSSALRLLFASILVLGIALPHAAAQEKSSSSVARTPPSCAEAFQHRLAQQDRILRQIWFGRKKASTMRVNSTRYDTDGNAWIKVRENEWRSAAEGYAGTTWSDDQIDRQTEWEGMNERKPVGVRSERIGIFEQKGVMTSELIPALVQSFRAFQCRTAMVCEVVNQSFLHVPPDGNGQLTIESPGCAKFVMPPIAECRFGNHDTQEGEKQLTTIAGMEQSTVFTECLPLLPQMAAREQTFLRIAVAYDAAMRSLLQSGGSIDLFIRGLRGDVLAPLEQTMSLLSQLSRIPCFSAQCNE